MFVLSRKEGEGICVGDDITITVVQISGRRVTIGIAAPDRVRIRRAELAPLPVARTESVVQVVNETTMIG